MWAEAMLSTSVGMALSSTWAVHTVDQQGEVELGSPWNVAGRMGTPDWMCGAEARRLQSGGSQAVVRAM